MSAIPLSATLRERKFIKENLTYLTYCQLTYYQRNRDVILNRAKAYYENDQERLREQARDKYRDLSEEEKNKKREYGKKQMK